MNHCLRPISIFVLCLSILAAHALPADASLDFITPRPTGNTINDVWSPDGQSAFLVGDGGTILQYQGGRFTAMNTPTVCPLYAVHGTSASNVWAVGGCRYNDLYENTQQQRSVILHYDGQNWSSETPPDFAGTYYVLNGVYAASASTVYATFHGGSYLMRRSGGSWDFYDTGLVGLGSADFYTVYGFGTADVFAAGMCGNVIHGDGVTWSLKQWEDGCDGSFSSNLLYDIWGPDADSVFVGGNSGQIYRYNDQADQWTTIRAPGGFFSDISPVYAIAGSSASDVYFAGQDMWHWDGAQLSLILDPYSTFDQNGMVRMSDGSYLVGHSWGLVSSFNGQSRTDLSEPAAVVRDWEFGDRTADSAWLCESTLGEGGGAYSFDGQTHTLHEMPLVGDQFSVTFLRAFADNDVWVGLRSINNGLGKLLRYDGTDWTEQTYPGSPYNYIIDLDRLQNGNLVMIKAGGNTWVDDFYEFTGRACVYAGSTLTCADSDAYDYRRIAARGNIAYAAGLGGKLAYFNSSVWSTQASGLATDLTDVAVGDSAVCVVGRDRTAAWKSGGAWAAMTGLTGKAESSFVAVTHAGSDVFHAALNSGNDTTNSYIGADKGQIYTFQNGAATMVAAETTPSWFTASSSGQGYVLFTGSMGALYGSWPNVGTGPTVAPVNLLLLRQ